MQRQTTIAHPEKIERKWYVIDAEGKPLGRLASQVAQVLTGKNKPTWTPNVDCGDYVIVINCEKVVLTGKKLDQKKYYHHTGYIGHLKEVDYRTLMATKPEFAVTKAIKGMIPDTVIGRKALGRLRVVKGAEHPHTAQKPETWEF